MARERFIHISVTNPDHSGDDDFNRVRPCELAVSSYWWAPIVHQLVIKLDPSESWEMTLRQTGGVEVMLSSPAVIRPRSRRRRFVPCA